MHLDPERSTAMDITNNWATSGPSDDDQQVATLPAFLEVVPGEFEPIECCTAPQIRAVADSKLLQAKALMDDARRLYETAEQCRS